MLVNKIFCITVGIPITEFGNVDGYVKELLKSSYENRCYMGYYIVKILDILSRGDLEIDDSDNEANGKISIQFKCTVRFHQYGEILPNCRIVEIRQNDVSAISDGSSMIVANIPEGRYKWIKKDMSVPMYVVQEVPLNMQENVHILASILEDFQNPINSNIYSLKEPEDKREVNSLIQAINEIKLNRKVHEFLLKKMPKFFGTPIPKKLHKYDLLKLDEIKFDDSMVVQYPSCANADIYVGKRENDDLVESDPEILITFLSIHLGYLTGVAGLSDSNVLNKIFK